ncbi:MAG: gluconeogenesis factor YvcK family protein, partial [Candidatus Limnocylindrales bacterium]
TGLSTLLRGLKEVSSNITAVVTVADDGGSSGQLRRELGVPPVGDIRSCIVALADVEPTMAKLMQYRFPASESEPGIAGHAFGNLLIAAMADITGDFEEGVRGANRVLAVRGQVVPVAGEALNLNAELADGSSLQGQSRIAHSRGIRRVWLSPASVEASHEAVEAVGSADLIVLGPGSLYTSLLPSLLVPGIRSALEQARGLRVYVANVATQPGETEGYTLSEHLAALAAHDVGHLLDVVLANDDTSARVPSDYPAEPVRIDLPRSDARPRLVTAAVVDPENAHRHDPQRLTDALVRLLAEQPAARPVAPVRTA